MQALGEVRSWFLALVTAGNPAAEQIDARGIAAPECESVHAHPFESLNGISITNLVSLNLLVPEVDVGLWSFSPRALVAVPETPIHEDRELQAPNVQIGAARQLFPVKTIPHA
jgi:hypothetical protein